jgi:hypothetical protein
MRYKGGVISATPPTTSTTVASGAWTLVQQMQNVNAGTWPIVTNVSWIGVVATLNYPQNLTITVDSLGNSYIFGTIFSGVYKFVIAKYSSVGLLQWQRTVTATVNNLFGYAITTDSNNNIYLVGTADASSSPSIFTIDANGGTRWQRSLNSSIYNVTTDASGNVYVCGIYDVVIAGQPNFLIVKYNASGVIQWQRTLGSNSSGASFNSVANSIATDSSENVYVCGYSTVSTYAALVVCKYNTSGTLQWQKSLNASSDSFGYGIAVDSSANVYVCGLSNASGFDTFIIAKYNTAGVIQWKRNLAATGGTSSGVKIAVDSSGNSYVCGSLAVGNSDILIAKYNTSGVIQWQRSLNFVGSEYGYGMALDSFGNMCISGTTNSGVGLFAKLPTDGSLTGSYTVGGFSVVYATSSLTDSVSTLTDNAISLTSATGSATDQTSTATNSIGSFLTSSVTTL